MIALTRAAVPLSAALLFATVLAGSSAEPGRKPEQTSAQNPPAAQTPPEGQRGGGRQRPEIPMDPDRARQL
jgi:hypothetical protein